MKLTTQDGRTLELDHNYYLQISGSIPCGGVGKKCKLTVATFNKAIGAFSDGMTYEHGDGIVERYGTVGEYSSSTSLDKARAALDTAWKSGAEEFTVPQDTFEKTDAEKFDDYCEEHGLICVTIEELGYQPCDRIYNLKTWRETDEFERRGILVCDPETHGYAKSLAKWQKLQNAKRVLKFKEKSPVERRNTRLAIRKKAVSL